MVCLFYDSTHAEGTKVTKLQGGEGPWNK